MKRKRFMIYPPFLKVKWKKCVICGKSCLGRRRTSCSKKCDRERNRRCACPRTHCYRRDKGICSMCGRDTKKDERLSWDFFWLIQKSYGYPEANKMRLGLCADWGYSHKTSFWEADHIVPLCQGGEDTVPNLRTLCYPCHKKVTRQMWADLRKSPRHAFPKPLSDEEFPEREC